MSQPPPAEHVAIGAEAGLDPVPWSTLPVMLEGAARLYAQSDAVVDGDVHLTFAELYAQQREVAVGLVALGLEPGDRVTIWAPNRWEWLVVAYAVWSAGGVVAPISSRWKGYEAAHALARAESRVLVTTREFLGVDPVQLLADEVGGAVGARPFRGLPALEHLVLLDRGGPAEMPTIEDVRQLGKTVDPAEIARRIEQIADDSLAEILFTSGTTGEPKGVQLGHGQLIRNFWAWSGLGSLRAGDRFLTVSPFSHGAGINGGVVSCVLRGVTNHPVAVFDAQRALDIIERERITVLLGPPALYLSLLDLPRFAEADTSSLRVAYAGAATVPTELIHRLRDRVGFELIINAYGLIEGSTVSQTRADDPVDVIATTSGRPLPGVEVAIADDDRRFLPHGEPGEILVRGDGAMRGYWRDPERSAEVLEPDGWLHTGDIGVLDAAGNLAIVDRKKEMLVVGGFNVFPAEVENLLLRHGALAHAAVIGVPDDRLGEVPWAFVVPGAAVSVDTDELVAWARRAMANYKAPRRFVVVDDLPLNANGKVDKQLLRERAATPS
jgi:acyl-CoA synthetase (AMP-forming)/AMP-acid ligase II